MNDDRNAQFAARLPNRFIVRIIQPQIFAEELFAHQRHILPQLQRDHAARLVIAQRAPHQIFKIRIQRAGDIHRSHRKQHALRCFQLALHPRKTLAPQKFQRKHALDAHIAQQRAQIFRIVFFGVILAQQQRPQMCVHIDHRKGRHALIVLRRYQTAFRMIFIQI